MENSRDFSNLEVNSQNRDIDFEDIEERPLKKGEKAKLLVERSLELISNVEAELDSIEDEILDDIEQLEEKRDNFLNSSFKNGKFILEKLKFKYPIDNENTPLNISLERRVDNINVKDISTGAFSGFILALISMAGVVGASIYFIASKLGIDLGLDKFPNININQDVCNSIFEFISKLVVGEANIEYGMAILGGGALIIGFIVYKIRVVLKENKNYKEANRIYEETNIYVQNLREQIEDFKQIGRHIRNIVPLIDNYSYLIDENVAKLRRALHVEGEKDDYREYHSKTVETLKDTKRLMKQIEELLTTPIIVNGALSQDAILVLNDAKSVYEYFVSKIYN